MLLPTDLKGLPFTIPHLPTEISPHKNQANTSKVNLLCKTTEQTELNFFALIVLREYVDLYLEKTFQVLYISTRAFIVFKGKCSFPKPMLHISVKIQPEGYHLLEQQSAMSQRHATCSTKCTLQHNVNHNRIHYAPEQREWRKP